MKDKYCIAIILITFVVFSVIHKISKNKKPVTRAITSMFTGLLSLFLVNLTGVFSGVTLPYSALAITVSMVGGIPGVTTLLGLNLFF